MSARLLADGTSRRLLQGGGIRLLQDSGSAAYSVATSDSAPASDALTRSGLSSRGLGDFASATDVLARSGLSSPRALGDSAVATDVLTRSGSSPRATGDSASATDVVVRGGVSWLRGLGDFALATDALSRSGLSSLRGFGDTAPATDAVVAQSGSAASSRTTGDSAPATDVVTRGGVSSRGTGDFLNAVVAYDTFNRPDTQTVGANTLGTSDSGHVWQTAVTPGVGITGGRFRQNSVGGTTAYVETGISDGQVEVTLADISLASGNEGITFRLTDSQNYWFFAARPTAGGGLFKTVANVTTSVFAFSGAQIGDRYRVVMNGTSISVYRNDTLLQTVTDAFNQTATKHGIYVNNNLAFMDNWSCRKLSPDVLARTSLMKRRSLETQSRNLVMNGSFEMSPTALTHWLPTGVRGDQNTVIVGDGVDGGNCVEVMPQASGFLGIQQNIEVQPGVVYTVSASFKRRLGTAGMIPYFFWFNSLGQTVGGQIGGLAGVAAALGAGWARQSWTLPVAPAGSLQLQLSFSYPGTQAGVGTDAMRIDAIQAEAAAAATAYTSSFGVSDVLSLTRFLHLFTSDSAPIVGESVLVRRSSPRFLSDDISGLLDAALRRMTWVGRPTDTLLVSDLPTVVFSPAMRLKGYRPGHGWVAGKLKVWDGTAWRVLPLYRWAGGRWALIQVGA